MVSGQLPGYWVSLYGDSSIDWVPPVNNYLYSENVSQRGINDRVFRWGEVSIDLTTVQSGAVLDFVMPDYYLLQITPDLGWHDVMSMFGESKNPNIHNPHLKNLGPFSIENGTLTDNADNSVYVTLTSGQIQSAVIDQFPSYLWRAVPWAQGNPGLGGLPASFTWVSSIEQLQFTVDPIVKETNKAIQVISGTKNSRVSVSTSAANDVNIIVEQTNTTWKVIFNIDRPKIVFNIIATDEGGSAIATYPISLEYNLANQYSSHVWNAFDGFALLASLQRLPNETNASLKSRIIDAFTNKGGTHYVGLINGINRELGLGRKDNAIQVERAVGTNTQPIETSLDVVSTHTRTSVSAPSFVIYDEIAHLDVYYNVITVSKRIKEIISIKTESNTELPVTKYKLHDSYPSLSGNEIYIDPSYVGIVKITYQYYEDIYYSEYPTVIDVVYQLNTLANPSGLIVVKATLDGTMSGSELSKLIYKTSFSVNQNNLKASLGWSRVGLFSIADEEYKWSFSNDDSTFFDSEFYEFVLELKSKTNIEWGFVIADKDYWDTIDAEWYGRNSLPLAFDIRLSRFVTSIPIANHDQEFDPWEAFRMGYYYNQNLIKNIGFPQNAFRSGVGYKRDCVVSVSSNIVSSATSRVNLNPIVVDAKDLIDFTTDAIQDIAVNI